MKLLVLFSFNVSLKDWDKLGILSREISLYKKIKRDQDQISFLTYGDNDDLRYREFLDEMKIFPAFNQIKSKNSFTQLLKSFLLPVKFRSLFKNIDIIKTNQISGCWITWLGKLLYRKKIIIRGGYEYLRNYISSNKVRGVNSSLLYYLRYLYNYILEFVTYRLADAIILTNKSDIEFIIKKFKLKYKIGSISHIYNSIDTNLFKPQSVKKKENHILFIGRILEIKNLINTLLALRKLENFTLDIIGDGPFKEQLREKAKKLDIKVNFLGIVHNEKLPYIINQYPIFILPSFYEGNPKVLLEAMSCGIACIGTDVRGINDIIIHEYNGYLCGIDSKSIEKAILTVYNDKDLMVKIGKSARQFILNNCSLTSIVEKEYRVYKKVLS